MKKAFGMLAASFVILGALQVPAMADPWFDRWDHNHDGHWTYNEFVRAHNDYWKHHRDEKRLNDAELRAEWDRRAAAHHEWVSAEDVRDFHHW